MSKVITAMSISVDGYVAGPSDSRDHALGLGGEPLFAWFSDGDTPSRHYPDFRMSKPSQEFFDGIADRNGAIISGRHTYDLVDGWAGVGPQPGVPLFVLTHQVPDDDVPYTFVTDGIESAIWYAKQTAGDKDVSLMGSAAVQQALIVGLLDEIHLHQVPILLGGEVLLLDGTNAQLELLGIVDAPGVTHLSYRVVHD